MEKKKKKRLISLDTLRGFDMFWIIGAEEVVRVLAHLHPSLDPLAAQLSHSEWIGITAYDLIFPLFLFIAGVAIPFSIGFQLRAGTSKVTIYKKVLKRALILIVLGIIYNKGLAFKDVRFASVLGQIGIAYLLATFIIINTKKISSQLLWLGGILVGYASLQLFFPVPGYGSGILLPEGSFNGWIDQMIIPGKLYRPTYDPEGIMCSISAAGITIMGALAGRFLKSDIYSGNKKTLIISIAGLSFIAIALMISPYYPIIKRLWTSSYNLAAGGISLLLLALFYWTIDVMKFQKWTFFFRVIGLNSITIYMMNRLVDFEHMSEFIFSGFARISGINHEIAVLIGVLLIEWGVLYFFYKKQIFLKV